MVGLTSDILRNSWASLSQTSVKRCSSSEKLTLKKQQSDIWLLMASFSVFLFLSFSTFLLYQAVEALIGRCVHYPLALLLFLRWIGFHTFLSLDWRVFVTPVGPLCPSYPQLIPEERIWFMSVWETSQLWQEPAVGGSWGPRMIPPLIKWLDVLPKSISGWGKGLNHWNADTRSDLRFCSLGTNLVHKSLKSNNVTLIWVCCKNFFINGWIENLI